ncbi:unnamed protein product [Closterium sp. NIES-64]|nr:unnamed protein product [Closterium sp. NIES-64]
MASGATPAVLTVQQLSARAAYIMSSTPWGRLMRPDVRLPHVQAFTRFLEASHRSLLQSLKIPSSAIFHRLEPLFVPHSPASPACFPPAQSPPLLPFPLPPLSYTYLTNSFAAQLTVAEARRLRRHPAVAEVERDEIVRVTSVHSPEFLKLDSSLWPANGGQSNAGEGVIIGVIDTGIWPEHPSFSNPDPNGAPYSTAPVRWRGVCTKTNDFTACNGKVVGARYFMKGMEREYGRVDSRLDYRSPRDMDQHGTWCAGAAAGNAGVDVTKGGRTFGTASGMAPRARLAIYKGLWSTDGYEGVGVGVREGVGVTSDLVAAANKAVADGVDIISCSWGGMARYFQDMPYLQALKAGVVTAFAAGNEGRPSPWSMWGTISNASPFYLTVGARREYQDGLTQPLSLSLSDATSGYFPVDLQATHPPTPPPPAVPHLRTIEWDGTNTLSPPHLLSLLPNIPAPHRSTMGREYKAVLTLGDGTTITGRSLGGTTATASDLPLVLDTTIVRDSAKVAGKFLVCTVGQYVWVKTPTLLVQETDDLEAAAILGISHSEEDDTDEVPFSKSSFPSSLPSPHSSLSCTPTNPTATLSAFTTSYSSNAPQLAYFSSTGPPRSPFYPPALLIRDFPTNDILKPDVIGPGYQLWSAGRHHSSSLGSSASPPSSSTPPSSSAAAASASSSAASASSAAACSSSAGMGTSA